MSQLEYWNPSQVAVSLGVSKKTVRSLQRKGMIPFMKLSNKIVLFDPKQVKEAISKFTVGADH